MVNISTLKVLTSPVKICLVLFDLVLLRFDFRASFALTGEAHKSPLWTGLWFKFWSPVFEGNW